MRIKILMQIRVSHLSGVRDRAVHVEQTDRTPIHDTRLYRYEIVVADLRALGGDESVSKRT